VIAVLGGFSVRVAREADHYSKWMRGFERFHGC
jgi:hypothetical protein